MIATLGTRWSLTGAAAIAFALGVAGAESARAQSNPCQKLQQTYQQEMDSAGTLKSKAAQQVMSSSSNIMSNLGIQIGSSTNAQQAIQKGALAASSPQVQNAILIQLLSANTHLQEMIWRGCKPSSG